MHKTTLQQIVRCCNRLLRVSEVKDYEGALNGLQVENSGAVRRVAAVVDASLKTLQRAAEGCEDLLVLAHHGLFWGPRQPWTGRHYKLLRLLLDKNIAVYSAHLPLDMHPKLGNNAQFAAALGLKNLKPFFHWQDQAVGLQTRTNLPREELARRLERVTGAAPLLIPGGPLVCRRIGLVTGGGGSELKTAAEEGVDTFITGEGPHWSFALAEELGLNVFYAGHYATETFGVKALAAHLSRKFQVPWTFIDYPTGM